MKTHFSTTLAGKKEGPTGIVVPESAIQELNAGKKPGVKVTVNGYEYLSTVAVMKGKYMISFSSAHRTASSIQAGDTIDVTLELELSPRLVEIPPALLTALQKSKLLKTFEGLAPSKRKEFARQVNEAKSEETRMRRIEKIIGLLQN